VVGVEQWAELRREHFVRGVSSKELVRRTGLSRNTVRAALRSPAPPKPTARLEDRQTRSSSLAGVSHAAIYTLACTRQGHAQTIAWVTTDDPWGEDL
jgi:hypothetical protein